MSFSAIFVSNRVDFALRKTMQQFAVFAQKVVKHPVVIISGGSAAYLAYLGGMSTSVASCEGDMKSIRGKGPSMKAGDAPVGGGEGGAGSGGPGKPDVVKELITKYSGFIQQLGFSGIMGACTGVALKRASREVATAIGIAFAGLQVLAYLGYITIDYNKVEKDSERVLDMNGDGKIDEKDLESLWEKAKTVLGAQLPQAGSFSTGFALGFYLF